MEYVKTKYPKTKIEAQKIIEDILNISRDQDKRLVLYKIIKKLNIKYRGKIAKAQSKTKHYGKFSNKHTVISHHTLVYYIYKKQTDDFVYLDIRKQKNNKDYGYYITLVTRGNLHHIKNQDEIWNKARDFYNNMVALTMKEHKELHNNRD